VLHKKSYPQTYQLSRADLPAITH